jgi:integrase
MALSESRHETKTALHAVTGEDLLVASSTGRIHSRRSREKYQSIVRRFIAWCQEENQLFRLEFVDARADELVTSWLSQRQAEGLQPGTLHGERSALRLFFQNWTLARAVVIPAQRGQETTCARLLMLRDPLIASETLESLERFFTACGIRRDEANQLRVGDIQESKRSRYLLELVIREGCGQGGRPRRVPVYPGRERDVLVHSAGLPADAPLFAYRIDRRLNPRASRRQYAQDCYRLLSGRDLPPSHCRLRKSDYDSAAVQEVCAYLGHRRSDRLLKVYLR